LHHGWCRPEDRGDRHAERRVRRLIVSSIAPAKFQIASLRKLRQHRPFAIWPVGHSQRQSCVMSTPHHIDNSRSFSVCGQALGGRRAPAKNGAGKKKCSSESTHAAHDTSWRKRQPARAKRQLARAAAFPQGVMAANREKAAITFQAQSFSNSTSRAVNTPPLTVPFTCAIRPTALAKKSSALVPSKSVPAVV